MQSQGGGTLPVYTERPLDPLPSGASRPYQYSPLEGSNAVRLLILQPDVIPVENGLPILKCDILHASLDWIESDNDELAYTAVSYVWGESEGHPIQVGDFVLLIGFNLYRALYFLRDSNGPVPIWADGVCINQNDIFERNDQVHRMKRIYQTAQSTVVFLGADNGNTSISAWNFLELESIEDEKAREAMEERFTFHGDMYDVDNAVLSCNWFRRVWVFQEVVVSRNIWVQCGWRKVHWDSFCKTILLQKRIDDRYGWSLQNRPLTEYLLDMFQARCSFLMEHGLDETLPPWYHSVVDNKGKGMHILTTLSRARRLEASDERDKIFALLGVSTGVDVEHPSVTPDYGKTFGEVYMDFARYVMETTGSYEILSHCAPADAYTDQMTVSWAPDWRFDLPTARSIWSTLEPEDEEQTKKRAVEVQKNCSFELGGYALCSVGRVIGKVMAISSHIKVRGRDEEMFQEIRQRFEDDQIRMEEEILTKWASYPWNDSDFTLLDPNNFETDPDDPELSNVSENLNTSPPQSENDLLSEQIERNANGDELQLGKLFGTPSDATIESHLIQRSRKTAFGSSDESLSTSVLIDRSSIIDGRRFQVYKTETDDHESVSRLALGPQWGRPGDYIVAINGARLPYIVRCLDPTMDLTTAASSSPRSTLSEEWNNIPVTLIGECLINDFERYDSVSARYESPSEGHFTKFLFAA